MIILHAAMADGQLWLWGESGPGHAKPRTGKTGWGRKPGASIVLPFGADSGLLGAATRAILGKKAAASTTAGQAVVWMPTTKQGVPAASSSLIAESPAGAESLQLAPWATAAVRLDPGAAVDLLAASAGRELLAPDVAVGADFRFWTAALRFAGALVVREQYLPGIEENGGNWRARWIPALLGPDTERAGILARAMPGSCRALSFTPDTPPSAAPGDLLEAFLGSAVDTLVRANFARAPAGPGRRPRPRYGSLHEHWVYSLRSEDGTLDASESDLQALAAQIDDWQRPLRASLEAPFRLCFRLEEPDLAPGRLDDPGSDPWFVRYFLQDVNDPSLLIPAEVGWSGKGRGQSVLKRAGFQATEYLLSALGHAANIDPRVEQSLHSRAPSGYECDTTAAFEFLTEKAWLLEGSGYRVLLPSWWTRKGTKQRVSARAHVRTPKLKNRAGLSMETIVKFEWQVALGGEPLTAAELEALASHKAPLVHLRGQWVQVNAEEIQAALDFWKKQKPVRTTVREVVRMALGAQEEAGLPVEEVTASGWMAEFLEHLKAGSALEELPPPEGLQATLRAYQRRGYSWLSFLKEWGLGACLADDMGLGKTVQVLALLQQQRVSGGKRPVLVICPTSVVGNWQKEAQRFTPDLPVLVHHGADRLKGTALGKAARKHALVLSSFSLLHRDIEHLKEVEWAGIVVDEAQNIKNPETKSARAARSFESGFRVALTGTPVENHVGDLWAIMEFLNPGFLGSEAEFRRRFFLPIQAEGDKDAADCLKRLTGPFILRRVKTDGAIIQDLPEKMEMKVFCTLTREQASLYRAVTQEAEAALDDTEGIQRRGVILATLTKLKQVCNHPAQFLGDNSPIDGRSGKLARLGEMLEEALSEGDSALIFSQFTEMGEIIRRHLELRFAQEVLFLHGGVPKKRRDEMVERFQSGDGPRLFLLSLKAGGAGLNLTRASHVFHFDRWWNPAVENQATDRAYRIGQQKNVQVHKFICAGTVEERIDEMIENKKSVAANVVGAGEDWITELSTDQIRDLFRLRAGAVEA